MINSEEFSVEASSPAMARGQDHRKATAEGQRLVILRLALGYHSPSAFAAYLDISPSRLSNIESQGAPVSRDLALKMAKKIPGFSIDWLWTGAINGLGHDLARRIDKVESELSSVKGKTRARS